MSSFQFNTDIIYTDNTFEFCDCGVIITEDLLKCECKDLSDFVTDTEEQSSYSESEEESSYSCSLSDYSDSDKSEPLSHSTY